MRNAKYRYKLATRKIIRSFKNKFSDELYESLSHKNFSGFWKTWQSKCVNKKSVVTSIDGKHDDFEVAEWLKSKFSIFAESYVGDSQTVRLLLCLMKLLILMIG